VGGVRPAAKADAVDVTDHAGDGDLAARAAEALEVVRRRSLDLLAPLPDDQLVRQHSPLMSPLVWDLAHVGNYEELWLVRAAGGLAPLDPALDDLYDAFRHPRSDRPALPLLGPQAARRYIDEVRSRALDVVDRVSFDPAAPLLAGGFVVGLVVQHEHQHDETMLATLQLMDGEGYRPDAPSQRPAAIVAEPGEVLVPGGPFVMGTDDTAVAYDNERPAHTVDLAPFWIDRFPVTNAQYQEFIADGGYDRPSLWTASGWSWRRRAGLVAPGFWQREGPSSWSRVRFGLVEDVPTAEPVQHVCWYEADAYARWAGRRLPTEAEWEKAVSGSLVGFATLGGTSFRPAPVGAWPEGRSRWGVQQMIGDVWEWTATSFGGYPGYRSFPYREYSEVFFGDDYRVLRGGSWATHPAAIRVTFRNWDYPIRRQIFAGFRCARDR
jgi:iron(II)-dependent oxidoreductase